MRSERDGGTGNWSSFLAVFWLLSGSFLAVFWLTTSQRPAPVRSDATNDAVGLQFAQMVLDPIRRNADSFGEFAAGQLGFIPQAVQDSFPGSLLGSRGAGLGSRNDAGPPDPDQETRVHLELRLGQTRFGAPPNHVHGPGPHPLDVLQQVHRLREQRDCRGRDWCGTRSFSTVSAGGNRPEFMTSRRSAKSMT